ncbi:MAG: GNAT family N-acetyltransferase [Acholeplasmatales bacterium]
MNLTIDKENNEYTISDVLIDMKYQGRGYGKALIKEALKELRKHGAKKISMGVRKRLMIEQ